MTGPAPPVPLGGAGAAPPLPLSGGVFPLLGASPLPPRTAALAEPLDPDAASALDGPLTVIAVALAFPVLPDCELAREPVLDEPGATAWSVAEALPVLPDCASAELEPIGATESAVADPEFPDRACEVGGGELVLGTPVDDGGPEPKPEDELFAAPVLVADALPASPERADAPALPIPPTAIAVASPELPDCADALCAWLFPPLLTAGGEPEVTSWG